MDEHTKKNHLYTIVTLFFVTTFIVVIGLFANGLMPEWAVVVGQAFLIMLCIGTIYLFVYGIVSSFRDDTDYHGV